VDLGGADSYGQPAPGGSGVQKVLPESWVLD
jgi:hypothetical protein